MLILCPSSPSSLEPISTFLSSLALAAMRLADYFMEVTSMFYWHCRFNLRCSRECWVFECLNTQTSLSLWLTDSLVSEKQRKKTQNLCHPGQIKRNEIISGSKEGFIPFCSILVKLHLEYCNYLGPPSCLF